MRILISANRGPSLTFQLEMREAYPSGVCRDHGQTTIFPSGLIASDDAGNNVNAGDGSRELLAHVRGQISSGGGGTEFAHACVWRFLGARERLQ
jgi:hypothetical protein